MKLKILKLAFMALILTSCSEDEKEFNFVGVWHLESVQVVTSGSSVLSQSLLHSIRADANCLYESTLTILPNNTAVINLTSKIVTSVQAVEGTTNEFEQVISCEEEQTSKTFSWVIGNFTQINEDGTIQNWITGEHETMRFIDDNGMVLMHGIGTPSDYLNVGQSFFFNEPIQMEFEGEQIEFLNSVEMRFCR